MTTNDQHQTEGHSERDNLPPSASTAYGFIRSVVATIGAIAFSGLLLYLWRVTLVCSDWAALILLPLAVMYYCSIRPMLLEPWIAQRRIWLRETSPLSNWLTGRLRATVLAIVFTALSLFVLAWQAAKVDKTTATLLLLAAFVSGCIFSAGRKWFAKHCHEPFARVFATSTVSWLVAFPFFLVLAAASYSWVSYPAEMLSATFLEALDIGAAELPDRAGWIPQLLAIPYGFDAAKLWVVVQLWNTEGYPLVAALFCLDAAVISFITCHISVVTMQQVERISYGEG